MCAWVVVGDVVSSSVARSFPEAAVDAAKERVTIFHEAPLASKNTRLADSHRDGVSEVHIDLADR